MMRRRLLAQDQAKWYAGLIEGIGEDLNRDGWVRTPDHAARALRYHRQHCDSAGSLLL